ncbi:MAG: DUF6165 family protein [Pseudomonadota bacterium]
MTNILTPISPGELVDKLTILEIKLDRIEDAQKRANVQVEYDALSAMVADHIPARDDIATLHAGLKTVNEELWVIEDDIRDCERAKDFGDTFVQLARAVYVTNDKRAALKKDINVALGSALVEEKSYADY